MMTHDRNSFLHATMPATYRATIVTRYGYGGT